MIQIRYVIAIACDGQSLGTLGSKHSAPYRRMDVERNCGFLAWSGDTDEHGRHKCHKISKNLFHNSESVKKYVLSIGAEKQPPGRHLFFCGRFTTFANQ